VTPSPAPTATLEPYQYKVQAGDTLFAIIQVFGYRDLNVVPEVIRLNNMANENDLKADQTLLIPRQTPTLGPTATEAPTLEPGITPTATIEVTAGPTVDYHGCNPDDNICVSSDRQYYLHEVREGDSIASIAYDYGSLPDAVNKANGSPAFIVPGQQIIVPILVTMTPTLTPTGGPGSTATPIPTLSPPSLLAPAKDEAFGRGDTIILQWVSVNALPANQYYMVIVRNTQTEQEHRATTHSNSYRLPNSLRPGIGQSVQFEWRVVVVGSNATTAPPISGQGPPWTFTWGP
jgi:LysM repeat protein